MRRLLLALLFTGCVHAPKTRGELETSGFSQVQIHGYAWGECEDNDDVQVRFTADYEGSPVSGVFCREWFERGGRVRFRVEERP